MVLPFLPCSTTSKSLSVLALSSRFDGPLRDRVMMISHRLSVLALSSRFDGPQLFLPPPPPTGFQYSLCRVVLMVLADLVC